MGRDSRAFFAIFTTDLLLIFFSSGRLFSTAYVCMESLGRFFPPGLTRPITGFLLYAGGVVSARAGLCPSTVGRLL